MAAHWRTPAGLHTSPARLPVEGGSPSFDGATRWLDSPPLTTGRPTGKRDARQLLDLHLNQLTPPAPYLRERTFPITLMGEYKGFPRIEFRW